MLADSVTLSLSMLQSLHRAEASQQTAPSLDSALEADMQEPPGILIMVSKLPYRLTTEEASKLSMTAFSALWTVSLHPPLHYKPCVLPKASQGILSLPIASC